MANQHVLRKSRYSYPVIIEQDENGYFVSCPALQGCHAQGDTYEEAMRSIEEAVALHIEARKARGLPIPSARGFSFASVEVRA